ncbi:hypothetical protein EW146_g3841 [Bondarzewia mesenterica]|uniref:Zn(2)-C6 fungal-type domain-containing protein n=1 Tax=Bondarzewia mesenterica TaxID=1095465 RepID=A0A4S4LWB4_9AGAM|nr:hypothetical protein EW146_g3841 [Bondarzewia mesenterica]
MNQPPPLSFSFCELSCSSTPLARSSKIPITDFIRTLVYPAMSSADEDVNDVDNGASQSAKKRRIQRACDICRRKKIRCDGGQMPGNRCSNCIAYNFDCTYNEAAKKRGPPKGYVESLETRLEKMEGLLQRLCPDADFTLELGANVAKESWFRDRSGSTMNATSAAPSATPRRIPSPSPMATGSGSQSHSSPTVNAELEPSDDEYGQTKLLQEHLKELSINPLQNRFFGKSSGVRLVKTALDLKSEYSGKELEKDAFNCLGSRRPEFWNLHPWERSNLESEPRNFWFPEQDLLRSLVELYFDHINIFLGLLHRPTFEKALEEGLHLRDEGFGGLLLLVCANGSRFSHDRRVLLEGTELWHSCGWKYFAQVQMVRKSLLSAPCLYDLQMYSLSVLFLQGCSSPQACWTLVGVGIRLAQDVGAHRRKVYGDKLTIEDELWKRAFWLLVVLDRLMSSSLGRPCAIQEEDFDLDLPAECDDEYWTHPVPEQAFKQPPGKPSIMSYFICFLKLNQILAFALRTIYSINKSKILLGFVGQQWEQHIVAELDSALNKWVDSVPDHLRWDPTREHRIFFMQSASLYSTYYHLQILIHRPFIPSPRKPSPLSFPSLAICTNAARSCSHVADVQRRRAPGVPVPHFQVMPAFTAGIVLLLSIWGVKRSGVSIDPAKEMQDVYKCMQILKDAESRWHSAGRLWYVSFLATSDYWSQWFISCVDHHRDVLCELASVGDLPLPQPSPPSFKRERDSDESTPNGYRDSSSKSSPSAGPPSSSISLDGPRTIAGSRRVSKESTMPSHISTHPSQRRPSTSISSQSAVSHTAGYPYPVLPVHSDELGRMPVHSNLHYNPFLTSMDPLANVWGIHTNGKTSEVVSGAGAAPGLNAMFSLDQVEHGHGLPSQSTTPYASGPLQAQAYGYDGLDAGSSASNGRPMAMSGAGPYGTSTPAISSSTNGQIVADNEMMNDMWSNLPSGFELEDWDTYISNVSGFGHVPLGGVNGTLR